MKTRIDWKPVLALLAAGTLLTAATLVAHRVQVSRTARRMLARSRASEQTGRLDRAFTDLSKYLELCPDDDVARLNHACLLERLDRSPGGQAHAALALERWLSRHPGRLDIRRRLAMLNVKLERFVQARTHLRILLKSGPADAELEEAAGVCDEATGDDTAAASLYARALTHEPRRQNAAIRLAELLRRQRLDSGCADKVIDGLVAADPAAASVWLARARYRQVHSVPGASDDLAKARVLAPDDPEILLEVAKASRRSSDWSIARSALERGGSVDPRCVLECAGLEIVAGRIDEAELILKRGIDAFPGQSDLSWALANLLAERGDSAGLTDQITRLRAVDSGYPPESLDYLAAWLSFHHGQWSDAERVLGRIDPALALWPEVRTRALVLRARCYERLGDLANEAECYRKALEVDPLNADIRLAHAEALTALGQTDRAADAYRTLVAEVPQGVIALSASLVRNGRDPEALELCERAWTSCPAEVVARATVVALGGSGNDPERLARAAARLESQTQSVPILSALGTVRELQGRFDDAERAYRQALTQDCRDVVVLNNLALLSVLRGGDPHEALALIDRAIERVGLSAELLDTRGMVRLARGDVVGAVADLEAAVTGRASSPFYVHLAQAYLRGRNRKSAVAALRKAGDLGSLAGALHPLERPAYRRVVADLSGG